jgi:hypothetical protein
MGRVRGRVDRLDDIPNHFHRARELLSDVTEEIFAILTGRMREKKN